MDFANFFRALVTVIISSSVLNAQYIPGHHAVELNSPKSGLSILNSRAESTSNLSLYSDASAVLDIGIGNSANIAVGPDISYLFTNIGTPLHFYIGGFRRMFITEDGNVGVNAPTTFLERFYVGGDSKFSDGTMTLDYTSKTPLVVLSQDSAGIKAFGAAKPAIYGTSNSNEGAIRGVGKENSPGVFGRASNGRGVQGQSDAGAGVFGISYSDIGVAGSSTLGYGISGESSSTYGVYGTSDSGLAAGILGEGATGVHGSGSVTGVYGSSLSGNAIEGNSSEPTKYDFYASGLGMDYGSSSSRRWKTNIQTIDDALLKVLKLRGVYFDWNEDHGGRHDIGFIAEEIGSVIPEIVSYEANGIDAIAVDYSKMTPLLLQAIIELQSQVEQLKAQCSLHHGGH